MTDERDPKVSQRYRDLSREEPPRHVDEAILDAARRAAETRPAPLVVPSGRRRWYFPLAAAAIIVLAVAVTVQVERQQTDPEIAVAPVTAPKVLTDEQTFRSDRAAEPVKPAAKPERARKPAPPPVFVPDPKPQAAEPQAAPAPAPLPASPSAADQAAASRARESARADAAAEQRARAEIHRAPTGPARTMASAIAEPPERWLERIVELRKQGKHDEADKALAEFRRTYPDYRISEAMLEKVEKK